MNPKYKKSEEKYGKDGHVLLKTEHPNALSLPW